MNSIVSPTTMALNRSLSLPASGDGAGAVEERPLHPDDDFPMPNIRLTKINGPPESISEVKEQLKVEIYALTKAFFTALEKERNLKLDPALVNEAAEAYYKSIQNIRSFKALANRYESNAFRGFLLRKTSKIFQNSFATEMDDFKNSVKSQNEILSDKISLLEKNLKSRNSNEAVFRSPKSIFEYFSIVAFLGSLLSLYLIFVRTY